VEKRKKYGNKFRTVAKCNNWSENWLGLSFPSFPKDLKTRQEWEVHKQRGDLYFKCRSH